MSWWGGIVLGGEKWLHCRLLPQLPRWTSHHGGAQPTGTLPCTSIHPGDHHSPRGAAAGDGGRAGGRGGEEREEVGAEEGAQETATADRSVPTGQMLPMIRIRIVLSFRYLVEHQIGISKAMLFLSFWLLFIIREHQDPAASAPLI